MTGEDQLSPEALEKFGKLPAADLAKFKLVDLDGLKKFADLDPADLGRFAGKFDDKGRPGCLPPGIWSPRRPIRPRHDVPRAMKRHTDPLEMAMAQRSLTDLLVELYRRLNNRSPEPDVAEEIRQLEEDNGLVDDQAPGWLIDVLDAALAGREVGPVLFSSIGSDIGSFLIEVAELIPGWSHDDQGESVAMTFPALPAEIILSREAVSAEGRGCASYAVRRPR